MKFFIDTANIAEIEKAAALGVADGVTTNPTLLAKESGTPEEIYKAICNVVNGPVCAEAISQNADDIIAESMNLAKIDDKIVVKIPATKEGLSAVNVLEQEGIKTNITLVFSPMQALLAAKVGASYICPFVGRLDDAGHVGMELIENILQIYENYGFTTEIIVASIRSTLHVQHAALIGAHIATIPYSVVEKLLKHPLTDNGVQQFMKDWDSIQNR